MMDRGFVYQVHFARGLKNGTLQAAKANLIQIAPLVATPPNFPSRADIGVLFVGLRASSPNWNCHCQRRAGPWRYCESHAGR